jgi:dihydrofolate reductase
MIISLIVAAAKNNAIGKGNKMLWHLPEDFKYFKNTTWGMPIIMGRKTFDSIGKALPGRTNIVVTNNTDWKAKNVQTSGNILQAIELAKAANTNEIFIAGGANIYAQTFELANKIYLTRVDTELDADTFFPEINTANWELSFEKKVAADEKNIYPMSFQIWIRKS